jgi:hypothetical protein
MRLIDLGDQDGERYESPLEMVEKGRRLLTAGKAMPKDMGAITIGLGKGVRVEIGHGAGAPNGAMAEKVIRLIDAGEYEEARKLLRGRERNDGRDS